MGGHELLLQAPAADKIKAVDLALASTIPPSPDQAQNFATSVANLGKQNVAVVAAAGNSPGAVEQPGAEPGVFAVGAATAQADHFERHGGRFAVFVQRKPGVGLYAPGCGLDAADPFTDAPLCSNGTSQASAFTAAVLVALMSYDPTLTPAKAEQLLVGTANAVTSTSPPPSRPTISARSSPRATPTPHSQDDQHYDHHDHAAGEHQHQHRYRGQPASKTSGTAKPAYPVTVRSVRWERDGVLTIRLAGMRRHATVKVTLKYAHIRARRASSTRATIKIRTSRPRSVVRVRVMDGKTALSATTTVKM